MFPAGLDLLYLYLLAPVYLGIAIAIDVFKNHPELYRRFMPDPVLVDKSFDVDDDVAAEAARVEGMNSIDASLEVIVMKKLRKVYGPAAQARPALPRSWVVFKSPSQTRMRHCAC